MLITLAAALLALASAGVVAWGLTAPTSTTLDHTQLQKVPRPPAPNAGGDNGSETDPPRATDRTGRTLSELQRVCAIDLRRPLFDPPAPVNTDTGPAEPTRVPMTAVLSATVIENGKSMAIFKTRDGKFEVCPIGGGFEEPGGKLVVTGIEGRSVQITWNDKPHTLEVPRPGSSR